jgi:SPP1 family predicted phage head-tail adaptor
MNEILTLITVTQHVDEYGDQVATESRREVFAKLGSIGQKEFYQAHAVGLQPELKFVLADYLDYDGEALVEYNGQRYRVLRTYRAFQELELTCYREVNPA